MREQASFSLWHQIGHLVASLLPGHESEEMEPPQSADPSPHLYNQRLAAYEWGAGEILLSPTAAFRRKNFLMDNAAALGQGFFVATSKADLLCLIALLHEFRHFQQDYLTGLGHWDHIARARQIASTISMAKQLSSDATAYQPLESWSCNYLERRSRLYFSQSGGQ
jgi:hypothetical protein